MFALFKKNICVRLIVAIVALAILGFVLLMVAKLKVDGAGTGVNAAELVRAVRESENWIHKVDSLMIRIESKWTSTPKGIAAHRAELKKQFADLDPDPERFWQLKPSYKGSLEYAFDQRRLRFLHETPGKSSALKIWDGKQAMVHEKYFTYEQEIYALFPTPERIGQNCFSDLSWLRAQPHSFWWYPMDVEEHLKYFGRPEDFVITGRSTYRGIHCYVLEWDPGDVPGLASGLSYRWHIGVKDQRLYGHVWLTRKKPNIEHWTLDYKEVVDDCWFPMIQGYEVYDKDTLGEIYLRSHRDLKVLEVRINEKLADELFQMEFKEGVQVGDSRFGGYVTYRYKANRTDEEWQEIREKARKRAEGDTAEKQFKDALTDKPAPPFPENATWLNSEPLTWKDLQGKVVILDFWADWCGPCKNDLPHMSDLHKEREKSGIVVIGIHTPGSRIEDIRKVMIKFDLNYPICIDTPKPPGGKGFGAMSSKYAVDGIPYAFVIDEHGNVAGHGRGVNNVLSKARELVER